MTSTEYREIAFKLGLIERDPKKNRETFTMSRLEKGEVPRLACGMGWYLDSLDTCESLEWELRSNMNRVKSVPDDFGDLEAKFFRQRHTLHQLVADPVCDGTGRSVAVGVACLIVFRRDKSRYQVLMRRRGPKGQPLRRHCLQVLPSGMFQSMCGQRFEEFSVLHNTYREYLEEVFSVPEPEPNEDCHAFYGDPRLAYLQDLIEKGGAEFHLTGVGINLMNLRPDICTLLLINDEEWYEKTSRDPDLRMKIGSEFETPSGGVGEPHAQAGQVTLVDDDTVLARQLLLEPHFTVPAGAAAFWLGVDAARRILQSRSSSAVKVS